MARRMTGADCARMRPFRGGRRLAQHREHGRVPWQRGRDCRTAGKPARAIAHDLRSGLLIPRYASRSRRVRGRSEAPSRDLAKTGPAEARCDAVIERDRRTGRQPCRSGRRRAPARRFHKPSRSRPREARLRCPAGGSPPCSRSRKCPTPADRLPAHPASARSGAGRRSSPAHRTVARPGPSRPDRRPGRPRGRAAAPPRPAPGTAGAPCPTAMSRSPAAAGASTCTSTGCTRRAHRQRQARGCHSTASASAARFGSLVDGLAQRCGPCAHALTPSGRKRQPGG